MQNLSLIAVLAHTGPGADHKFDLANAITHVLANADHLMPFLLIGLVAAGFGLRRWQLRNQNKRT